MPYFNVQPKFVYKGKIVHLKESLPLGFGNTHPIPKSMYYNPAYVESEGFEGGVLKIRYNGELLQFNAMSAEKYLECDPWI